MRSGSLLFLLGGIKHSDDNDNLQSSQNTSFRILRNRNSNDTGSRPFTTSNKGSSADDADINVFDMEEQEQHCASDTRRGPQEEETSLDISEARVPPDSPTGSTTQASTLENVSARNEEEKTAIE